jgi:hypothetical protein
MSPDSHAVVGADITIVVMASALQVKGFIKADLHEETASRSGRAGVGRRSGPVGWANRPVSTVSGLPFAA